MVGPGLQLEQIEIPSINNRFVNAHYDKTVGMINSIGLFEMVLDDSWMLEWNPFFVSKNGGILGNILELFKRPLHRKEATCKIHLTHGNTTHHDGVK
ncbi:hypothetical protein PBCV1_a104L [Paramecium bursaria Chlorella virus 1]|uniref:Uncharacterized protein n=1 Tax=Paramecium bursaria Chlorella virus 1 TaxID=10506 RepID=Q84425_PBCV1|nr:hypothetical protein PBCV1_a104L [Paramecium bursaria Chlorella virus 1]AAC96472.1 hypothetical protein [Paramecium bursaria Chlorella virus 1]